MLSGHGKLPVTRGKGKQAGHNLEDGRRLALTVSWQFAANAHFAICVFIRSACQQRL